MAKVSISEASRLAGISRPHFYRKFINSGVITVERDGINPPLIDTSEILRLFGKLTSNSTDNTATLQQATPNDTAMLQTKIELLEIKNQHLQELMATKDVHLDDMRQALRLLENKSSSTTQLQSDLEKAQEIVKKQREEIKKLFLARRLPPSQ